MKREGRHGDWHRVMKNRDQVHLSQLEQYKTLAQHELELRREVYADHELNYDHSVIINFPIDFNVIATRIVQDMPAHRNRLI